jgi:hypothetical protein
MLIAAVTCIEQAGPVEETDRWRRNFHWVTSFVRKVASQILSAHFKSGRNEGWWN